MSQTKQPVTTERVRQLLDAYGGAAERWPDAERDAALRLLQGSSDLRARWEEASDLDQMLDSFEAPPPSRELAARVLAVAPRRRTTRIWGRTFAAAIPLAAAAALVVWLTRGQPQAPGTSDLTIVSVGEYESPTDVLLGAYGVDVYAAVPEIGCSDSTLGCPDVKSTGGPVSRRQLGGRIRA